MNLLNGHVIAEAKLTAVAERARAFEARAGRRPSVAVVLVGHDPASELYVKLKQKKAQEVGIDFHRYTFAQEESPEAVLQALTFLEADPDVDAILIQMPVPEGHDADQYVRVMGAAKDVDGFHPDNKVALEADQSGMWPVFPHAIMTLVEASGVDVKGKRAALVVKGEKFGRVLAAAVQAKGMTPQIVLADQLACMQAATLGSEVVITACGAPGLITSKYVKPGAVVIDGGISKVAGETVGDVDVASFEEEKKEIQLSPVPGGVGPVTIACLLENVVALAEKRA